MKSLKQHAQAGFTLIELVVVIVILGILAATALPRFFDLTTDARKASVAGSVGSFASGVSLLHAKWLVGGGSATTVTVDGRTVSVNSPTATAPGGFPAPAAAAAVTAATCQTAWEDILSTKMTDFNATGATSVCVYTYKNDATRSFNYDNLTGVVSVISNP